CCQRGSAVLGDRARGVGRDHVGTLEAWRRASGEPRARARRGRESKHGARGAERAAARGVDRNGGGEGDVRELGASRVEAARQCEGAARRREGRLRFARRGTERGGAELVRGVFAETRAVSAPRRAPRRGADTARVSAKTPRTS